MLSPGSTADFLESYQFYFEVSHFPSALLIPRVLTDTSTPQAGCRMTESGGRCIHSPVRLPRAVCPPSRRRRGRVHIPLTPAGCQFTTPASLGGTTSAATSIRTRRSSRRTADGASGKSGSDEYQTGAHVKTVCRLGNLRCTDALM